MPATPPFAAKQAVRNNSELHSPTPHYFTPHALGDSLTSRNTTAAVTCTLPASPATCHGSRCSPLACAYADRQRSSSPAGGGSATLARACIYPTMAMLLLCIIHAFKRRTTPARNRTPPPHLGSLVLVEHVSRTSGKVAAVDASSPLRNACLLRRRCEDMDRDGGPWIWHRSRRCLWVLAVLHDVHPDTRTLSETIPHILK